MNLSVGEKIKKYRLEKGMTQEELGKELGVGKAAVQKYESGQVQNLKSAHIKKLCTLFNTIPWDFIFDGNIPPKLSERKDDRDEILVLLTNINKKGINRIKEYVEDICKIDEYKVKSSTSVPKEKYDVEPSKTR